MQRFSIVKTAAATLAAAIIATVAPAAALPGPNAVAAGAPCHVSIFGSVTAVSGRYFTLHALRSGIGNIHVDTAGARVNTNNLSLRPGVFAGVYGCYAPQQRYFKASEVTLAANAQSYSGYQRRNVTTTGTVVKVESGRLQIRSAGYGYLWVYTSQTGFSVGQRVTVSGSFNPMQSSLDATNVAAAAGSVARTVTTTGTVVRVEAGRLQIRSERLGYLWVYTSRTGFAAGQRVSVTGTLNAAQTRLDAASISVIQ
jgi:ribosomal protein S8E